MYIYRDKDTQKYVVKHPEADSLQARTINHSNQRSRRGNNRSSSPSPENLVDRQYGREGAKTVSGMYKTLASHDESALDE